MTQLPKETQKNGDTNKSKGTNKHAKHKPRLNMQKNTRPNRAVWTGPGRMENKTSNEQPKCQEPLQLLSPPFLMTSTTKQMRPNGKGGGEGKYWQLNQSNQHSSTYSRTSTILVICQLVTQTGTCNIMTTVDNWLEACSILQASWTLNQRARWNWRLIWMHQMTRTVHPWSAGTTPYNNEG